VLAALLVALGTIAAGTWIGLLRGRADRFTAPTQTFALVSVLVVVCGQLLPEAISELGLWALGVFLVGFILPGQLERVAPHPSSDTPRPFGLGLELGYVGLLLHTFGDGLILGGYTGEAHTGHGHWQILGAVGAHTVPVTALVVVAYRKRAGTRSALLRSGTLAATSVAGILVAGAVPTEVVLAYEPWITAAVSGLLLHVVGHGWAHSSIATTERRFWDFAAVGAGVLLVVLDQSHTHLASGDHPTRRVGAAFLELLLETAPFLLLGLCVAALLQLLGTRLPTGWLRGGSTLGQAVRGALVGAPLPVCACGVLPIAHALRARGGTPPLVVAFLLATPELGVETFALTVQFLGWPFAFARLGAALVVAVVGGLAVAWGLRKRGDGHEHAHGHAHGHGHEHEHEHAHEHEHEHAHEDGLAHEDGHDHGHAHDHAQELGRGGRGLPLALGAQPSSEGLLRRLLGHLDELVFHIGPWTLLGLLVAAYVQVALPEGALGSLTASGLDIPVVLLLSVPMYVCASSATPFAAVLLAKGLSPGAVLAGLLLGPATNVATIGWLRANFGPRGAWFCLAGILASGWLLAIALNLSDLPIHLTPAAAAGHEHGALALLASGLLAALAVRGIWRAGLQSWLGSLGESLSAHNHEAHSHHSH
jgi:uncharacterized membrane protein YraQ (UPF0718 family)